MGPLSAHRVKVCQHLWPAARVAAELERTSQTLEQVSGKRPRFFRPPAAVLTPENLRPAFEIETRTFEGPDGGLVVVPEIGLR